MYIKVIYILGEPPEYISLQQPVFIRYSVYRLGHDLAKV